MDQPTEGRRAGTRQGDGAGGDPAGALPTRRLGAGGPVVSALGLGTAALGRPGYLNVGHGEDLPGDHAVEAMEAQTHRVLDAAYAAGVRYVDAARSYGRAEAFVASWLASRGVRDVVIGSKWGYRYTAGWRADAEVHEVKDHTLPAFRRQLDETRAVLGDRLDLYQVHSATLDSGILDDRDVLAALARLAESGVLVGLSLSGPQQGRTLRRALELAADGLAPFRCVQATWNLLEPSAGAALRAAHDAGWGVIVKEGVANGRLAPRGDVGGPLHELAQARGVGVDAVALAAAMAQPFADVVLSGAATVTQLESNLDAVAVALDDEDLERLRGLAEPADAYWGRRSSMTWT